MDKVYTTVERYQNKSQWAQLFMSLRTESLKRNRDLSISDSKQPYFRQRNRYADISPYNHTRIRLQRDELDYINASLIEQGGKDKGFYRRYILTQGPISTTCSHFWLMAWEQKSTAIIMLNKCRERNHQKCEEYWPTSKSQPKIFDDVDIQVFFEEESSYRTFIIRTLRVKDLRTGEERIIKHFHYVAWPDFGVPESPEHFLRFLGKLRRCNAITQPETPPIVHCSAGVGRSGTLCLIDVCLEILANRKEDDEQLDVLKVLHEMRRYRPGLIQAYEQLAFSFTALIAAEKCKALDEEEEAVLTPPANENDQEVDGNSVSEVSKRRQQRWIDTKKKLDEMKRNQENHNIRGRRRYVTSLTIGGVVFAVAAIVFAVYLK